MARYRKKPIIIEAVKYLGPENIEECKEFCSRLLHDPVTGRSRIWTSEGLVRVRAGDYIIKDVQGKFYPCKPDIFEQNYDCVLSSDSGIEKEKGNYNEK